VVAHDGGRTVFEVECGKGTYVRSIARDMGRDLGCYGHVADLRRTEVDPFTPDDLVTLPELEAASPRARATSAPVDDTVAYESTPTPQGGGDMKPDASDEISPPSSPGDFTALDDLLIDTGAALACLPQVAVGDDAAARIRLGNPVIIRGRDAPVEADEACATARGRLVAIGAIEAGMFRPKRVFAG
jgi:tRNA pseudouridine55 synthase